ncbi:hypothetical protein GRI97_08235 [Altererythrobacter xixiisoli]|uniref:Uncharacterized protein n=1 Tax=Croceibacterium xixiisoli TaxID=1476466 RepID=A0A6I4TS55_9SPHN|nr:hypothetical protein [Croceibacterium xixiisoli]
MREDDRRETPDLRDQFSMAALTGLMAAEAPDVIYESEGVARRAYRIADAMLVARAEGGAA